MTYCPVLNPEEAISDTFYRVSLRQVHQLQSILSFRVLVLVSQCSIFLNVFVKSIAYGFVSLLQCSLKSRVHLFLCWHCEKCLQWNGSHLFLQLSTTTPKKSAICLLKIESYSYVPKMPLGKVTINIPHNAIPFRS